MHFAALPRRARWRPCFQPSSSRRRLPANGVRPSGPLLRTLAALVPATIEGVVRDVTLLQIGVDGGVSTIADEAGCRFVEEKGFSGRFGARRGIGAFTLDLRGQGRRRPVADLRRGSGSGARRGLEPGWCPVAARVAAGLGPLVPVAGARGRHHPHARPLGRDTLHELRRTRSAGPPGSNAADVGVGKPDGRDRRHRAWTTPA